MLSGPLSLLGGRRLVRCARGPFISMSNMEQCGIQTKQVGRRVLTARLKQHIYQE